MKVVFKKEYANQSMEVFKKLISRITIEFAELDELKEVFEQEIDLAKLLEDNGGMIKNPIFSVYIEGDEIHIEYSDEYMMDSLMLTSEIFTDIMDFAIKYKERFMNGAQFMKQLSPLMETIIWPMIKSKYGDIIEDGKNLIERIKDKVDKFGNKLAEKYGEKDDIVDAKCD